MAMTFSTICDFFFDGSPNQILQGHYGSILTSIEVKSIPGLNWAWPSTAQACFIIN